MTTALIITVCLLATAVSVLGLVIRGLLVDRRLADKTIAAQRLDVEHARRFARTALGYAVEGRQEIEVSRTEGVVV